MGYTKGLEGLTATERAQALRAIKDLSALDYLREVKAIGVQSLLSQSELAALLHVSQPAISKALKAAARVAEPTEGFSGASAMEIISRYVARDITRARLIDELGRWDFSEREFSDGPWDDLDLAPEGTLDDLGRAYDDGVIDEAAYDAILRRQHGRAAGQ